MLDATDSSEPRRRGPRPQYGDAADVVVRVRMTEEQRQDLEQVARDNQTTLSAAVREAVNEYVSDYRDKKVFKTP